MKVDLFVPCLAQDFCPQVALAAAAALEKAGFHVRVPKGQTCCGQPLYKQGQFARTKELAKHWIELFEGAQTIVAPSASCVQMVRHYPELLEPEEGWRERAQAVAAKTFELCEFLAPRTADALWPRFPGKAVYHESCQVRGLGVERAVRLCMERVPGLELVELEDPSACCGFGGTFSLKYPEISQAILEDKLAAIDTACASHNASRVITAEISCMYNVRAGIAARGHGPEVLHVAQVLAGEITNAEEGR